MAAAVASHASGRCDAHFTTSSEEQPHEQQHEEEQEEEAYARTCAREEHEEPQETAPRGHGELLVRLEDDALGLGATLRSSVKALEVFWSERPLLRFRVGDNVEAAARERLGDEDRRAFFELQDCTAARRGGGASALGVCVTNALPLSGNERAVLAMGSRINHSCAPNAAHRFDSARGVFEFYALRELEAGEPVLIAYVDATLPREARQQQLQARFGFTCGCEVCSLEGEALEVSERRRAALAELDAALFRETTRHEPDAALALARERLALLREEPALASPLNLLRTEYDALCVCQEAGRVEGMREWIAPALEHAVLAHGRGSSIYRGLLAKTQSIQMLLALHGEESAPVDL